MNTTPLKTSVTLYYAYSTETLYYYPVPCVSLLPMLPCTLDSIYLYIPYAYLYPKGLKLRLK